MKHAFREYIVFASLLLAGCSTVSEGMDQEIAIDTNPDGATCEFSRDGAVIAKLDSAPGKVKVRKSKSDIMITCRKPGYTSASFHNKSDIASNTYGNLIIGGAVGWAIDSASGADNHYTNKVSLTLLPEGLRDPKAP